MAAMEMADDRCAHLSDYVAGDVEAYFEDMRGRRGDREPCTGWRGWVSRMLALECW